MSFYLGLFMNLQKAEFIKSAAAPADFINDGLRQIVFAGKSNVGKSSVINKLLGRKNFARVGAVPGKTAYVNYFLIYGSVYFVDLPGYGYAKVPEAERKRWARLMESFFQTPDRITLGFLIVDARHAPTGNDVVMADLYRSSGRPFAVIANKADKLKPSEIDGNLRRIRQGLELPDGARVVAFSAERGTGRNEIISIIEKS